MMNWGWKGMAVAAHRGDSYNVYENTMAAFEAAWAAGADMIETDIRLTKDGVAVLIHDATVNRTSGQSGRVNSYTLEELRQINVGGAEFLQVPTLEEFLQWAAAKELLLNLELKEYKEPGNEGIWERCADEVVRQVRRYGLEDRVVLNSFDAAVLDYIDRKYDHAFRLHGFYPYSDMRNVERDPDEYLFCACVFPYKHREHYTYLLERGIEPWVGATVTSADQLALCCSYGATLVTTNDPGATAARLQERGLRA